MASHRNGTLAFLVSISVILNAVVMNVNGYGIDDRLEINLLESLLITDRMEDVMQVPGVHGRSPAFLLQDTNRYLELPGYIMEKAANLLRSTNEFTLVASIKQDIRNSGSVFAIAEGRSKFLELYTSTRRSEIKFLYTSDNVVHHEKFPYDLKPDTWTKLAVTVSGTHLSLYVDCQKIYERVIHKPDLDLDIKNLVMYLGQRNEQAFFKGMLQDVKLIVASHGYLSQCSELERQCPTCGEYQQMIETIGKLSDLLQAMENRVIIAEERIAELEECKCQRSCEHNEMLKLDSETWTEDCQDCTCSGGNVECSPVACPVVSCKYPIIPDGQCCPVCRQQCYFSGQILDDGEEISPRRCVSCKCQDGDTSCVRLVPEEICPKLSCPVEEQFSVDGECCKFCQGVDYCHEGNDCHPNATCITLATSHTCQCKPGFQGDGKVCVDVDECKTDGGPYGHHCRESAVCVNVPGSYICQCLPGYKRVDGFTCIELDECFEEVDECHANAQCINTVGSYKCQCLPGYEGDGFYCQAICDRRCKNGGWCARPNVCHCPSGYLGAQCQTDIDECASGTHGCHSNSECINLPGSYYCQCKTGYYSNIVSHSDLGASCRDIDECHFDGSMGHTCHDDMTCVNEDGGYQCQCNDIDQCHGRCIYEGEEKRNGQQFKPTDTCYTCTCQDGVTECSADECDCSSDTVDLKCCPHCDFNGQCLHQDRPVVYDNGDRWQYMCQNCQCVNGRIDCVDDNCPRLNCEDTVTVVGQCCPICLADVCSVDVADDLIKSGDDVTRTCAHNGGEYADGDRWKLDSDLCTECVCRRGHTCCSFNPAC